MIMKHQLLYIAGNKMNETILSWMKKIQNLWCPFWIIKFNERPSLNCMEVVLLSIFILVDFLDLFIETKSHLYDWNFHWWDVYTDTIHSVSAGIGRTGTYIAFDVLCKEGKSKDTINVARYVKVMRSCRMNMVQTYVSFMYTNIT